MNVKRYHAMLLVLAAWLALLSCFIGSPAQAIGPLQISPTAITAANAGQVKQIALLEGHKQAVFALAFSPDSKALASASIENTVRLWDVAARKPIAALDGHTKQAVAVAFSADGATLFSAGYDALRMWDVKTGKQTAVQAPDADKGTLGPLVQDLIVAFSPDGAHLAYGALYIWDTKTAELTQLQYEDDYLGLAFSPDGAVLAGSSDTTKSPHLFNQIRLWDVKTGKLTKTLVGPDTAPPDTAGYMSLTYSPDGALIAVVDQDAYGNGPIQVWDVKTGKPLIRLEGHKANPSGLAVSGLAFNKDGSVLATASYDKTLVLWDVKTGKSLATLNSTDTKGGFSALKFSPDGAVIAAANLNGTLQLFAIASGS